MSQAEAPQLTEVEIMSAGKNYIACLNLEPNSRVLIVSDELPITSDIPLNPNMHVRARMTSMIGAHLADYGHEGATIRFSPQTTVEEMKAQALEALHELDQRPRDEVGSDDKPTTIVYLGDAWSNRPGLYDAADEFGKGNPVRFAGSLGFSTGDARVMSQIGPEQLSTIRKTNQYFERFFSEHPNGTFSISTRGEDGVEHSLSLDYDASHAPFETDMGQVGEGYGVRMKNRLYSNIPGGEKFAAPYPYTNTNGTFAAEGLTFAVSNGIVTSITVPDTIDVTKLAQNQRDLIAAVTEGKQIPIAELGLGFYALAGIKTYSDSSTLSLEKGGPHIGFGHAVSDTPEAEEMGKLAGDFHHGDMVLDNPVMTHINPQTQEETPFYPPEK